MSRGAAVLINGSVDYAETAFAALFQQPEPSRKQLIRISNARGRLRLPLDDNSDDGEQLFLITSDREKILGAMERHFVLSLGIGSLVRELTGAAEQVAGARPGRRSGALRRLAEKRTGSA